MPRQFPFSPADPTRLLSCVSNKPGVDLPGYFRMPMGATKAIADVSDEPDLLATYIVLARFAFGYK